MHYGLYGLNQEAFGDPAAVIAIAKAAEDSGFDSFWIGEHVMSPGNSPFSSPKSLEKRILDPIVTLGFLAACTHKIRLGTGITILPQREPVLLAKQLASLDVLSRGRLIFGLQVGHLDLDASSIDEHLIEHPGTWADEYLAAIIALWMHPQPDFHGQFINLDGIPAYPRPVQWPKPPIVVGGCTSGAHRRAILYGNGWYGFNLDFNEVAQQISRLRETASNCKRGAGLGELEINVIPKDHVDALLVRRFTEIGVHRIIFQLPLGGNLSEAIGFIHSINKSLINSSRSL